MTRLSLRPLITAALLAALVPLPLAMLDLEQPAHAKGNGSNGGGHGGGNGGGHGGGNGNGNGGSGHGNNGASAHASAADAATDATEATAHKPRQLDPATDPSLSPAALGKLNGVLHASPQALANASSNSPLGMARAFGEALGGFLDPATDPTTGEEAEQATVEDLGALMAGMTNKPVTAAQVTAVADRLAKEDPENTALQDLDPGLAQEIADEANRTNGYEAASGDVTTEDAAN